jgi:hypothetical protein
MGAGPMYPATVHAGAVSVALTGGGGLREGTPIAPRLFIAVFSTHRWRIWISSFCQTVTNVKELVGHLAISKGVLNFFGQPHR